MVAKAMAAKAMAAKAMAAKAMAAVPMIIVPMRKAVTVPVLKSIATIITTPVLIVLIGVPSFPAVVAAHGEAMHGEARHRKATHPTAVAAPCAAAMRAATAARQRCRIAERHSGEADNGGDRQCSCRHRSTIGAMGTPKGLHKFHGIIAALVRDCDSRVDQKTSNS
jgi:hypothetical protein